MSRNQRLDSPTLTWSSLQHLLENALPHVLIILDCCFAANAARDTTDGTAKELLAACGRENPTLGVGIRSFTSALIEELQAFGNKPFSVVMLHARLVTLRWRLAFTPIHTLLSEHGGTSIQLAPLPIVDVSMKPISDQSLEGSERNPAQDISVNTANTPSSPFPPPPPTPETRVLLSVSVARGSYYDLGQWATWLTSQTPLGVTNVDVRLESVFDSHSTLFVVSLPTYAWVRLPEKAAYQFVGFIRSGNLLSNNQASADSTTHLLRKRKSTVLEQADVDDVEKVICLSDFLDEQLDTQVSSHLDSGYFSPKRVEKYLRAERLHETEWMECTSGQM